MRVDQVFITEGATNDLRGALSLIGVNQRVLISPTLPVRAQLRVVTMLTDEVEGSDGKQFDDSPAGQLAIAVIDPDGKSNFVWNQTVTFPTEKKWVDLPLIANVVADFLIAGNSYGIYLIEVRYTSPSGTEQTYRIPIYVVPQPANPNPEVPGRAFDASGRVEEALN